MNRRGLWLTASCPHVPRRRGDEPLPGAAVAALVEALEALDVAIDELFGQWPGHPADVPKGKVQIALLSLYGVAGEACDDCARWNARQ